MTSQASRAADPFVAVLGVHRGPQPVTELVAAGVRLCDSQVAREHVAAAKLPLGKPWESRAHYVATVSEESLCPSLSELALLRGYVECVTISVYREGLAARMLAADYAGDDGHATVTFAKRGPEDWTQHKCTWAHGPWPFLGSEQLSLPALLDHIERWDKTRLSKRWQAWRDTHPGLCR